MAEERITRAVAYIEGQETSEIITRAVAYWELTLPQEQITRAVAYWELTEESIRISRAVVYVELVDDPVTEDPKPSANREPSFYAHIDRPDSSAAPAQPFDLRPIRWSWTRPGGPDRAQLDVLGTERNVWQHLPQYLRAPVTIYNSNHSALWWGFVNAIELFANDMIVGLSLDGLYNRVAVAYNNLPAGGTSGTPAVTSWAANSESVNRFGQKELRQNYGDATTTQAEAVRDGLLGAFAYVLPDVRPGRAGVVGRLVCRGWWQTLGWRYYENSSTGSVAISDQIEAIVGDAGQFLTGFDAVNPHLVSSNEYRDGSQTAQEIIEELLQVASGGAAAAAWVTKERLVRFGYEPASGVGDWLLLPNKQFRSFLGGIPDPGREILGWTQLRGILPTDRWGYMISPTPMFIAENEFDAASLTYTWRARGAQSPWL